MELTPQAIRSTSFRSARKGYDPGEVDEFKERAASAVEAAQNQAAAMEARARAAVARLQELSSGESASAPTPAPAAEPTPSPADAEVISRTLLLAQRTADSTVAEAQIEAERLVAAAQAEATLTTENARQMAGRLLDEARSEARRSVEEERLNAENEVQSLLARRDFLLADVEQLEQYVVSQRERLRDAAVQMLDMVDRVPGGFADMRRPLLSAAGDDPQTAATAEVVEQEPLPVVRLAGDDQGSEIGDPTPAGGADPDEDTGELEFGDTLR